MSPAVLPSASTQRPRTYLISGLLGVVCFTLSWAWWDGQSFLGSFFLELGGGAFIVFLLEVLLPSALGYADSALARLQVTTLLEWSDDAVEALLAVPRDETEQARLLAAVERGPFPVRRSALGRVVDTGERRHGHRVLERSLPGTRTTLSYYVSERAGRRRTVVIVGLRRRHGDG
jgi:hypothetical protein